jgi:Cys-tRNA(Pro) deacylase
MSVTQGDRFLKSKKIEYEGREYDFTTKGAEYAAEALDWPAESMVKTLVVSLGGGSFALCLLPADRELSLKKLGRLTGAKSVRMATVEEAQKLTGYLVGGISPFGVKKLMPVWMHETIAGFEKIGINGGRRGYIVFLNPEEMKKALNATAADLAM